jgi:two-component system phosphate regulon sensor histidine kinase PhoR
LARSSLAGFSAAILLELIPAAVVLAVLSARGAISITWVVVPIGLGLIPGIFAIVGMRRAAKTRASQIESIASALLNHTPPHQLIAGNDDQITKADTHLLDAIELSLNEVASLNAQREEFGAILRGMAEAVVVTGANRQVILLNDAARRLFMLSPTLDYRGRDLVELCRDPRLQELVERITVAGPGEPFTTALQMQIPAPRSFDISSATVRYASGAAGHLFVFHDVTQLKAAESARTDFIANLTHELRTPLTALYGYAETLQRGVDDPATANRFLGIIERQARRLARLLDDLISLSDLERGLSPLTLDTFDPNRVIEESVELMREAADRRDIKIEVVASDDLPKITADHDRLHQVLINLLDNAIKYTPRDGSVKIQARAARRSPNGSESSDEGIEFIVADTGEGIPAAHIPRLTERFYRVDRARSRELGGTGLGLAIVKHITQLHGGQLNIESRVREGTTVKVWLPCANHQPT